MPNENNTYNNPSNDNEKPPKIDNEKPATEDIENLTAEDIENLTAEDIENLAAEDIENLTAEDIENLTAEDIENLAAEDIEKTSSDVNIEKLPSDIEALTTVDITKKESKLNILQIVRILCAIVFVVFTALFINEVFIQPWRLNNVNDQTRHLYNPSITPAHLATKVPLITVAPNVTAVPTQDPTRDEQGRLLTFQNLLAQNPDTKGWIKFPKTNIDYVVLQNNEKPTFYLTHDFNGEKQKGGSLYLDSKSSVEENAKNMLIYGHNMKSTDNMFHYLEHMKKLEYFKKHTVLSYDTIYQTGQWKIISVFITPGSDKKEPFFNFTRAHFKDNSDYLNFIYQLRIRSMYNLNSVDINENDQIVTLCTCTYEVDDYREIIVARKVREGEDPTIDVDSITKSSATLYPEVYYDTYGGEAPSYPASFEEALDQDVISWYKTPNNAE